MNATPFGKPVVPEVYRSVARSSRSTGARSISGASSRRATRSSQHMIPVRGAPRQNDATGRAEATGPRPSRMRGIRRAARPPGSTAGSGRSRRTASWRTAARRRRRGDPARGRASGTAFRSAPRSRPGSLRRRRSRGGCAPTPARRHARRPPTADAPGRPRCRRSGPAASGSAAGTSPVRGPCVRSDGGNRDRPRSGSGPGDTPASAARTVRAGDRHRRAGTCDAR